MLYRWTEADSHEMCRAWAAEGECEKNPGYMLEQCADACAAVAESAATPAELPTSFYDIIEKDSEGRDVHFSSFRGKVVYLVNTASYCGYTKENFESFRHLSKFRKDGLEVVIAPCNQFGFQEPGDATAIGDFANKEKFEGIILAKADVNGPSTRPAFAYLKHHTNTYKIDWNFDGKFLCSRAGRCKRVSSVEALEDEVKSLLYSSEDSL